MHSFGNQKPMQLGEHRTDVVGSCCTRHSNSWRLSNLPPLVSLRLPQVYFFTSFFYSHLKRRGYDGVKRWTKKVSVFSRRLLLLPLHLGLHWALGVVRLQTHEISLCDSAPSPATTACLTIMSRYLTEEAKARDRPDLKVPWSIHLPKNLPRQMNGNDCGVFVLEYCRCLVLDRPFSFSQADIPRIRRRILNEIQEGVIAVDK
ncbi:sentrin-specific protease 5-like isoform X2 [Lampetra planeri]